MSPETEAGRALLANVRAFWYQPWSREEQVAAIEAEARSLAIDRALEAVKGLPRDRGDDEWDTVVRREVIEKLESLR